MRAASAPRSVRSLRILEISATRTQTHPATAIASLFRSGDVLVVNDAATLPATVFATTAAGAPLEARLLARSGDGLDFTAALMGAGDHRTRTEDRPPPPRVVVGERLVASHGLVLEVLAISAISPRLVDVRLRLDAPADDAHVWAALYRAGKPVQYAHVPAPLALWDVQNVYASRPWAMEMPSAGRVLDGAALARLRARGVAVVSVTHAAGISATGDPAIDACLPLPERWHVPAATADAIAARASGARVVAVGTSVARALEAAARTGASRSRGRLVDGEGVTDLLLGPDVPRLVVDAILTGVHERETTHFSLLGAFAPRARLDDALDIAERDGLEGHELGDAWLVWGASRRALELAAAGVGARPLAPAARSDRLTASK